MKLDCVMLYVPDVPAAARFYEEAFGMTTRFINEDNRYAQMETGGATLAFAHEDAAGESNLPTRPNRANEAAPAIQIALVTEDIDAAFARVVAAGGTVINAPTLKPWGQSVGHVRDLNGIIIEIGTPADESWHDDGDQTTA